MSKHDILGELFAHRPTPKNYIKFFRWKKKNTGGKLGNSGMKEKQQKLAFIVSEKFAVTLTFVPLCVICHFSSEYLLFGAC